VNTLGSILGSALGGLFLVPYLSVQIALELMSLLYAIPGLALFFLSESRTVRREQFLNGGIAVAMVLIALSGGRWDSALMSSGLYLMRNDALIARVRAGDLSAAIPDFSDREVLYHAEGAEATVTVLQVPHQLTLKVGGKPEGSSTGDATTQTCLTLLPELLHPTGAKEVLLIGLGTGVSAGSALAPESVERVDAVEMSPEVVHASAWFDTVNQLKYSGSGDKRWIDMPRVETIVNDGRNHLLLTSRQYDVIACEPSNPWMAGVGNLFTKESFELSRNRLKPGGIMCQWIHSYSLDRLWFNSVVKTFCEVFPHVQIWQLQERDFLLVGTELPLRINPVELRLRLEQPGIKHWLKEINAETVADILSMKVSQGIQLRQSVARAPLHTDDNMLLEFNAPRSLQFHPTLFEPSDYMPFPDDILDFGALKLDERLPILAGIDRHISARERNRFGAKFENFGGNMPAAQRLAPKIRPVLAWQYSAEFTQAAELQTARRVNPTVHDYETAVKLIESAVTRLNHIPPDLEALSRARINLARRLMDEDQHLKAIEVLKLATEFAPERLLLLATAYFEAKDYASVRPAAEAAEKAGADACSCAYWTVRAEQILVPAAARALLETFLLRLQSDQSTSLGRLWLLHGQMLLDEGNTDLAIRSAGEALRLHSKRDESRYLEAQIYRKSGRLEASVEALRQRAYMLPSLEAPWMSYTFARLELASAMIAQGNAVAALGQLHLARRATEEFTVLYPANYRAWEARARNFLLYEKADPTESGYRAHANAALKKMLECLKGDLTKVPPDLVPQLPK
jgi:tetratricopeptide (TPR) repeat protein